MIMKVMLKVMMMICGYAFLLPRSILKPAGLIKTLPSPRAILIITMLMIIIKMMLMMIIKMMFVQIKTLPNPLAILLIVIIANDYHPLAIMISKGVKLKWLDIFWS